MGLGGKVLTRLALAMMLGAVFAGALTGLLHGLVPARYESVATLYMPAASDEEVGLAPPPDNDLPPIHRYTSAALASLRMPDYATLSLSDAVTERVATRLATAATEHVRDAGPYTVASVRRALHTEAREHWSGVYQVIYQRALRLRVHWADPEIAALLARIWAEEATAFLAEVEGVEEPPLIIASLPSDAGAEVGVPARQAIVAGAFLGAVFAFLAVLSAACFFVPSGGPRDA